ncbi:MarP family serine protease [Actinocatenispora comari]|uniref:Serine protease n=1 Tax=Actinocatenispora comari TaxID=2807577 RepID=A0A8J4AD21_9ACTN|nr:MarP family serine protease [Actinocatenispora comari]GIL29306.1 serine protease [Actinocatenispora comari]
MYGSVVDIVVVVLAILFAINGYRQGFVVGILSFVGFIGGALIGLQLTPITADHFHTPTMRVIVSLATVLILAVLLQALAAMLGTRIRRSILSRGVQVVDDLGGAAVSIVAVLVVSWMIAVPLGSSSVPWLAKSVRTSAVLHGVDSAMPSGARVLYNRLRDAVNTSDFPDVFSGLTPTQVRSVPPPDSALASSAVVQRLHKSVVKVIGDAPSCSRRIEGSGFVYSPQHVLTNAHVVAGTRTLVVENENGDRLGATVVAYDSQRDLAVLYVPDLTAPPLAFAGTPASEGKDAIVLGYPLDGPYTAEPARVRDRHDIRGPNIYDSGTVVREVYTIRSEVRSGNSGGPLVTPAGTVYGVIFAAAADDPQTGFALTAAEAAPVASKGRTATGSVDTGSCT